LKSGGQGLEGTLELESQGMVNRSEATFHDRETGAGLMCWAIARAYC
jgi:hypothetical protein